MSAPRRRRPRSSQLPEAGAEAESERLIWRTPATAVARLMGARRMLLFRSSRSRGAPLGGPKDLPHDLLDHARTLQQVHFGSR
jgi:hypothetical protein